MLIHSADNDHELKEELITLETQMRSRRIYVRPLTLEALPLQLEEALLGASMYRSLGPIQIDGQESAGEYDYSDGTFNNVWLD